MFYLRSKDFFETWFLKPGHQKKINYIFGPIKIETKQLHIFQVQKKHENQPYWISKLKDTVGAMWSFMTEKYNIRFRKAQQCELKTHS